MAIDEWTSLRCDCGGELFAQTVKVRHKTGGGIAASPYGYKCCACDMDMDSAYLIKREELRRKKADVIAAEAEVAEAEKEIEARAGKTAKANLNVRV